MFSQTKMYLFNQKPNLFAPIQCCFNNTVKLICQNKKCYKNPFICEFQTCPCRDFHLKCPLAQLNSIIKILYQKTKWVKLLEEKITCKIQKTIDQISQFLDKLVVLLSQDKQVLGFQKCEKQLYQALKTGQINNITGNGIFNVVYNNSGQDNEFQQLKFIRNFEENFLHCWDKLDIQIKQKSSSIQNEYLKLRNQCKQPNPQQFPSETLKFGSINLLKQSNIIKQQKDLESLISFYQKHIASLDKKFIASENCFKIQKFYQSCGHLQNTLTIIKTRNNKIIGGFTPLAFNPSVNLQTNQEYIKDQSNCSFLFSLSQRQKFPLIDTQNSYAITRRKKKDFISFYGTLWIYDNANQSDNYFHLCQPLYYNTSKYPDSQQSYEKIVGEEHQNFLVSQWQTYQVNFK